MSQRNSPTPWSTNADSRIVSSNADPNAIIVHVPWTPLNALIPTTLEPLGYQIASYRPGKLPDALPAARITKVRIHSTTGISTIDEIDHDTILTNIAALRIRATIRLVVSGQPTVYHHVLPKFLIDQHGNLIFTPQNPPNPDHPSNLASSFAIHDHLLFESDRNYSLMLDAWIAIIEARARNAAEANLLPPAVLATNHATRVDAIIPKPISKLMVPLPIPITKPP